MGRDDLFSIRQMVELTGLSEFTIRGWENRYAAFSPSRTRTGRRGYAKADIEKALLLRELLKRGHKIGRIATLSHWRLQSLFEDSDLLKAPAAESPATEVQMALEFIALQKWSELRTFLANLPNSEPERLIQNFILPAMRALAAQVASGMVSISQEHVFSSFLKEKIYATLLSVREESLSKMRFVLAAPEGDFHEIGLLLAHLLIRSEGFISLYLGPHTPALDLAETSLRFNANHILIVSTISKAGGARQELLSYVSDVQRKAGSKPRILIAGNQVPLVYDAHDSPVTLIPDFAGLSDYLKSIKPRPVAKKK